MAHRAVLTARQRASLFGLPTDEPSLLQHYTLSDEDIDLIRTRRRPENQIGFALQLCALRFPGRLLTPGETIPEPVTRFLAAQLGLNPDDLGTYPPHRRIQVAKPPMSSLNVLFCTQPESTSIYLRRN